MSKRAAKKDAKDSAKAVKGNIEEELKEVKEEGIPTIDQQVPNAANYTIVKNGSNFLSCYLMWSDVKNNHNKFYIMQVLQGNGSTHLFTRYGRVGDKGQVSFVPNGNAANEYRKTYNAKVKKGYTEIKMAVEKPKEEVKEEDRLPSKLEKPVQELINLIFNLDLIEKSVVANGFDVKKLPLGNLSKETILEGYKILRNIE
jgi:poly [ADP-ribose] polymerase